MPVYQSPDHRQPTEQASMPISANAPLSSVPAVAKAMQIAGVEGAGLGHDTDGNDVLIVYLRNAEAESRLPNQIDGLRIQAEITGPITAR